MDKKKKTAPAKFKKSSPETVKFLEALMDDVRCESRRMFGYPCFFIKGNMFTGLFADDLFFRVDPEKKGSVLKAKPGYGEFEPLPGRIMKEYLVIRDPLMQDPKELKRVIQGSLEYASSLPAKKKK